MPSTRTITASIIVLLLVGGASAAVASAEFKITELECTDEGIPTLCLESGTKLFEAQGAETYLGKLTPGTVATLLTELGGEPIEITCGKDESTGEVVQTSPLVQAVVAKHGILKLSECQLLGTLGKKCKVPTEKSTTQLEGTVLEEMPVNAGLVKPETGTTIIEVPFENKGSERCPSTILGTHKITGEDLCTSAESEVDETVHLGECVEAGSKLHFGEESAIFEAISEVELSGTNLGKKWDVSLG
jgi:hypothetical protein